MNFYQFSPQWIKASNLDIFWLHKMPMFSLFLGLYELEVCDLTKKNSPIKCVLIHGRELYSIKKSDAKKNTMK